MALFFCFLALWEFQPLKNYIFSSWQWEALGIKGADRFMCTVCCLELGGVFSSSATLSVDFVPKVIFEKSWFVMTWSSAQMLVNDKKFLSIHSKREIILRLCRFYTFPNVKMPFLKKRKKLTMITDGSEFFLMSLLNKTKLLILCQYLFFFLVLHVYEIHKSGLLNWTIFLHFLIIIFVTWRWKYDLTKVFFKYCKKYVFNVGVGSLVNKSSETLMVIFFFT